MTTWYSRQGKERTRNSDAAAVGQMGQYLLAVLVDGAEKGPRGAELARHWARVGWQAMAASPAGSPADVQSRLKAHQFGLRHLFLKDIACYCMVCIDLETLWGHVWSCGDCRVGLDHYFDTRWLNTPHTLAHQPGVVPPTSTEERARHHHQLTRCLNARRFRAPDHQTLRFQHGQTLFMCTDGYGQESSDSDSSGQPTYDDASLLTLTIEDSSLDRIEVDSDTDNLVRCSSV